MAQIIAPVEDGKLKYDYAQIKKEEAAQEALGSKLGYDQFLQLLCAEMQYQDPLEPTSNTDYVAQMATFSQLEATLSMENTTQSSMANNLVGKQVILKSTDSSSGETKFVDGKVDYVMYQEGEIYLSVNNALYPLSDLDTVADQDYYDAVGLAKTFENMIALLPSVETINNLNAKSMVESVREIFDGMTDYQKNFISTDALSKLNALEERLKEIENAMKDTNGRQPEDTEGTDGKTDNS